jgi:single-stranded DNA-specific DHH superfamily exonuclease
MHACKVHIFQINPNAKQSAHPSPRHTLLVPDKDADGLSATKVLYATLQKIGLPEPYIHLHFLAKGSNVHAEEEKEAMSNTGCARLIVLDQGSRRGPPLIRSRTRQPNAVDNPADTEVKTLLIDHHYSHSFPDDALVNVLLSAWS